MKKKIKSSDVIVRKARVSDLSQLVEVENLCFDYDQLTRRNFHWMIRNAHSIFLVLAHESKVVGYGLVLINSGTSLARLYSICTLREYQGLGLASKLIKELETRASDEEDCAYLRLEVRSDNFGAISLYKKLGYRQFTEKPQYYDDGISAFCFEKRIRELKSKPRLNIPYHQQGTDFTCGPACLLMAMKAQSSKTQLSLTHELQIWREATTIFMTSGHGGCGPQGLALAAKRRGFSPELYLSHAKTLFLDTVRSPEKKEVIELVQKDFDEQIKRERIKVHQKRITLADLKQCLKQGGIPIVLISTYHLDHNRIPHWVVVTAYDDSFVYIHDPDQDLADVRDGVIGRTHIPIQEDQFLRISRWGKDRISATVVIYK